MAGSMRWIAGCGLVVGVLGAGAFAGPRVAIVAAASNTANPQTNTRFTDPRDKLVSTGEFDEVAIFSTTRFQDGALLSLADLEPYDAVLVYSNDSHEDSTALGNLLADYVDQGGGVVHAVFGNTSTNPDRQLLGRWQSDGYWLIPQGSNWQGTESPGRSLGQILEPGHPIMDGVNDFFAFGYVVPGLGPWGAFRPNTRNVAPGATKVALWDDGATLVVVGPNPRVVELGMHPVSSAVNNLGYWDETTDGARLMANALLFTIEPSVCPADLSSPGNPGVGDGILSGADFFEFLVRFETGDLSVDFSSPAQPGVGDGLLSGADFFEFLALFSSGCP